MKISKETAWVLEQAFMDKDIHVEFVERVYDYTISNMYEGGNFISGTSSTYLFNLIDQVKDIKSSRTPSKTQVNNACKELIRICRETGLQEASSAKYDTVEANQDFLDFITDEVPEILESPDELMPESLYVALAMISLYFYAFTYSPGNVRLSVIKEAFMAGDFISLFRGLDYHRDAEELTKEYQKLKRDGQEVDPFVFKHIDPIDTSHIPDFLLEDNPDYTMFEGQWYLSSEVMKMITAGGQVAQSLERQDLEGGMTSVNMTDSEEVLRTSSQIIEGLKSRRVKKGKSEHDARTAD